MAAALELDTAAVMAMAEAGTQSDAAGTAMLQAEAGTRAERVGTLAAVNAAAIVAAGQQSAAADSVAVVAVADSTAAVVAEASTAVVVADTGKLSFKVVGDPISRGCGGWDFWRLGGGL